jgi:hypothetical protein
VNPPPDERSSIRMDARFDPTTRTKVDELAHHFHRPRAAVLCQIMHWGLSRGQIGTIHQGESQGPVRLWCAKSSPASLHCALLQCLADRQWKFDLFTGSFVDDE